MIEEKTGVPNRADARRLAREANALAVVKAIRRADLPGSEAQRYVGQPELVFLPYTALEGNDPAAPGYVYFAYCANRIKIGYTTDVQNRIRSMASNSPMPVTLLLTIRGSETDEAAYHRRFEDDRVNLEWFEASGEIRHFLMSKFECGTFEAMAQAEHDCIDFFLSGAEYMTEVFVMPFGKNHDRTVLLTSGF